MTRELIGFLMISLVAVVALLVWLLVRNRRAKQEAVISAPLEAARAGELETFYVSTVFESAPLDRVWAHGFAMRGKASIGVDANGISVNRTGERNFLIPRDSLTGIGKASATIDKGVERDGLTQIRWSLGGTSLLTNFRFAKPAVRQKFEEEVAQLMGAQIG